VIERYATLVLTRFPPGWFVGGTLALAVAAALVIALWIVVLRARGPCSPNDLRRARRRGRARVVRDAGVVTRDLGRLRAWYALPFVAPLALLVALAAACRPAINSWLLLRRWSPRLARAAQGWLGDGSTLGTNCRATATPRARMLADLDSKLTAAQPGSTFEIDAFPSEAATSVTARGPGR